MHRDIYPPSSDGTRPHDQLELFGCTSATLASTSVLGLTIFQPCPYCGSTAVVGSSCAMHSARLTCRGCGRHSRWLSRDDFRRLAEIVGAVGHPTIPIDLHRSIITGLSTFAPGTRP
jgi:hypothetical protein